MKVCLQKDGKEKLHYSSRIKQSYTSAYDRFFLQKVADNAVGQPDSQRKSLQYQDPQQQQQMTYNVRSSIGVQPSARLSLKWTK